MTTTLTRLRQLVAFDRKKYALARSSSVQPMHDFVDGVERENARLQPVIEALIKVAERYARHDISCDHYDATEGHDCTCGYNEALREFEAFKKEEK